MYTFNLEKGTIEKLQEVIPSGKRSRIIRDYIIHDYSLPTNLDELQSIPKENEVYPFYLNESAISKIDALIKVAANQGLEINRSTIMRDVLQRMIKKYEDNPIEAGKRKEIVFYVPKGTVKALNQFVPAKQRSIFIEDFILSEYTPSSEDVLKEKKDTSERFKVYLDEHTIEFIDELAVKFNTKSIKRSSIGRDIVLQALDILQTSKSPKQKNLDEKLHSVIQEYKEIYGSDVKKIVNKILED